MFCIGWGGNQFTPLLVMYRERVGYSTIAVDIFLAAYVFGLVPGLLVGGPLSDLRGRKPLLIAGVIASMIGVFVLALGPTGAWALIVGRLLCGLSVGIGMAVGTSWIKELSQAPHDLLADAGSGARRAALSLTLGFAIGAGVAGSLAQWGPWHLVLPYIPHLLITAPLLVLLPRLGVETRFDTLGGSLRSRLRVPAAGHRRFIRVVLPMAPWVFTSAGIAYAIIPQLESERTGSNALLYATALTVTALLTGALIQPIARRLDDVSSARAIVVSMVLMTLGAAGAAVVAHLRNPVLGFLVALTLGAAYGIAVVSGLLEIQRIATPDELAGLNGVYYSLAYAGFLIPSVLAALNEWLSYTALLGIVALIGL
ncbi:MAG: transporter permease, partial [Pseudonocardiales bacterium]|nr:transporter permease [Pseudonocardiales bacterium]